MENREIRKEKTEVDLKIPVNVSDFPTKENDCFGNMWDMSSRECPQCADKDLCAIIFKGNVVDKRGQEIKEELGLNHYLDERDFAAVTHKKLIEFVKSGETTTEELKEFVAKEAKCDDMVAVVNKIKNWIKSEPSVYTKGGVVWIR